MGERTKYTPGTFSWTDLATTDQDGGQGASTPGCSAGRPIDNPVGDGVVYSMMTHRRQDGRRDLAAAPAAARRRRPADCGTPTSRSRAPTTRSSAPSELGATVHAPAFDVMDVGRMGVVQDPQGAYFLVWEPKATHRRLARQRARGAVVERARLRRTWTARPVLQRAVRVDDSSRWRAAEMPYTVIKNADGRSNGGIRPADAARHAAALARVLRHRRHRRHARQGRRARRHAAHRRWTIGPGKIAVAAGSAGRGVRAVLGPVRATRHVGKRPVGASHAVILTRCVRHSRFRELGDRDGRLRGVRRSAQASTVARRPKRTARCRARPTLHAHPQAVEPVAGAAAAAGARARPAPAAVSVDPTGPARAQPVSDAEIRQELAASGLSANSSQATLTPERPRTARPSAPPPRPVQVIARRQSDRPSSLPLRRRPRDLLRHRLRLLGLAQLRASPPPAC